jgi:hypothetical protein
MPGTGDKKSKPFARSLMSLAYSVYRNIPTAVFSDKWPNSHKAGSVRKSVLNNTAKAWDQFRFIARENMAINPE